MNRYNEDSLPEGQPVIKTENLQVFLGIAHDLIDPRRGYSTMAAVVGTAGSGKTIAAQALLATFSPQEHSGLPAAVGIKVRPSTTRRALAKDIGVALEDAVRGRNSYELIDAAADAILRNDVKLLVVDEADWLKADSFDMLRHLHDKTGCPVMVVGLPNLLNVIDAQEKFSSRVSIRWQFEPPSIDEVLGTILPQMVFSHWRFDPTSDEDRQMGKFIWHVVTPSLRKLRSVLQNANQMAIAGAEKCITTETIVRQLETSGTTADRKRLQSFAARPQSGTYESDSERRNAARDKRRRNAQPV